MPASFRRIWYQPRSVYNKFEYVLRMLVMLCGSFNATYECTLLSLAISLHTLLIYAVCDPRCKHVRLSWSEYLIAAPAKKNFSIEMNSHVNLIVKWCSLCRRESYAPIAPSLPFHRIPFYLSIFPIARVCTVHTEKQFKHMRACAWNALWILLAETFSCRFACPMNALLLIYYSNAPLLINQIVLPSQFYRCHYASVSIAIKYWKLLII